MPRKPPPPSPRPCPTALTSFVFDYWPPDEARLLEAFLVRLAEQNHQLSYEVGQYAKGEPYLHVRMGEGKIIVSLLRKPGPAGEALYTLKLLLPDLPITSTDLPQILKTAGKVFHYILAQDLVGESLPKQPVPEHSFVVCWFKG